MAGYVATARIDRGRPRVARPSVSDPEPPPARAVAGADAWVLDVSPPGQQAIELRWAGVKERWSQLWFFVLDPESWR